jgi:hypothetical protein
MLQNPNKGHHGCQNIGEATQTVIDYRGLLKNQFQSTEVNKQR